MAEKKLVSPALILVPIGVGVALLFVLLATRAKAAPQEYICPYCGESFDSYGELVSHIQSEHPGERIPLIIEWE